MKKTILPPTYLLIFLALEIGLHFIWPIVKIINYPYNYTGIVLIGLGLGLNIWADNLFKNKKTTVKPNEIPSDFINTGPFSFSRHPMYLGMVILLLGGAIALGSVIAFFGPMAFFPTSAP